MIWLDSAADHPRSRGVYLKADLIKPKMLGSSPLARGLLFHIDIALFHRRIIPARAGFTKGPATMTVTGPDHPRSRGVYA